MSDKIYFSREQMQAIDTEILKSRGISIEDIAKIAYAQESKYNKNIRLEDAIESVEKILSLRDVFHIILLGAEIDRLAEEGKLSSPLQEIIRNDLGVFGIDEILGLNVANLYGVIGQTNFGDIDVNKPSIVGRLNEDGKPGGKMCHTFMDDIVGGIAAAATTRMSQIASEEESKK